MNIYQLALTICLSLAGCKDNNLTQHNEINLAGCEVPAGMDRAKAENIRCDGSEEADTAPASGAMVVQPNHSP